MITQAELKTFLDYDRNTGIFTWKHNPKQRLRRVVAGDIAGSTRADGSIYIAVCGKQIAAHRLAWLYEYGQWPTEAVIHLNKNRSNNPISNLAQRTKSQYNRLRCKQSNNTSGVTGVSWDKRFERWDARIVVNKKVICLYTGPSFKQACRKRRQAEKKYNI